jgi:hypothetical protein
MPNLIDWVRDAFLPVLQNIATAVKGPWRQWVIRPLVTVVAAIAMALAALFYVFVTTLFEVWNSDTWKDQ